MYRVLIADNERIVVETIQNIILDAFPGKFEVSAAYSGNEAVEQAIYFQPDIVYMDISMRDGGIQALKEIRHNNRNVLLYVISACNEFDCAVELIRIGINDYLKKPFTKDKLLEMTQNAIEEADERRYKRNIQADIQKKFEAIIPVMENWFVSSSILHNEWKNNEYLRSLLDFNEEKGYVCVFQPDSDQNNVKTFSSNPVNMGDIGFYTRFRTIVKSYLNCIVGNVISNRVAIIVPFHKSEFGYEERMKALELMQDLELKLEEELGMRFRIGLGSVRILGNLRASFHDANVALHKNQSNLVHISDINLDGNEDESFPSELENRILQMLECGEVDAMRAEGSLFFDWIIQTCHHDILNIRMRILEYVIWTEREMYQRAGMNYSFAHSENYLREVEQIYELEDLRSWFLNNLTVVSNLNRRRQEEPVETVVSKAQEYISLNFRKDITLEDVSKMVNVSPYYFSKLFKGETGENFIDYLTRVRLDWAIKLLEDKGKSIKEISLEAGYADPNYFSRIFKKRTGMTPREFRNNI